MAKLCTVLVFGECEHDGDLEQYVSDINKSGGNCSSMSVNADEEVGFITVDAPSEVDFWMEFKKTTSYGFLE